MEFKDYLAVLRRRWLAVLVTFLALEAIFGGYLFLNEQPSYTAVAKVGVRDERRPYTATELLQFDVGGYSYFTKEALITSKQVYDTAAAVYLVTRGKKLDRRWWRDTHEKELAEWLRAEGLARKIALDESGRITSIEVDEDQVAEISAKLQGVSAQKPDERVQLLRLTAVSGDGEDALLMANAMAKGAVIYSRTESIKQLAAVGQEITTKLDRLQRQRDGLEPGAAKFKEKQAELDQERAAIAGIDREIKTAQAAEDGAKRRFEDLHAILNRELASIPGGGDDEDLSSPLLDRLRSDIVGLRIDLSVRSLTWSSGNSETARMRERLAGLENEFRNEMNRERARSMRKLAELQKELTAQIDSLRRSRLAHEGRIATLSNELKVLDPERRELETVRAELERVQTQKSRIDSSRDVQQGYYSFEEVALDPTPSPPRWPRSAMLLGAIAVVVAIAAAFLVEYADANIHSDYDLRRHLNLPCVALIEDVGRSSPLILRASPRDPLSESFNTIATIIRSYLAERTYKVLTVCSAIPREGKTTVACNLAVAMARKGLRVALVDADLRIPQVHSIFGLQNTFGLVNVLRGEVAEGTDPQSFMAETAVESLWVLPSGPMPDAPAQLLESRGMVQFMQALREKFDVVIFDTPPITSVGDTLTLARLVDSNLLVIGAGLSTRRVATWAKQLLNNVRADICGAVLNFSRGRQGSAYYYYYYTPGKDVRTRP